jgi:hypothetical protein
MLYCPLEQRKIFGSVHRTGLACYFFLIGAARSLHFSHNSNACIGYIIIIGNPEPTHHFDLAFKAASRERLVTGSPMTLPLSPPFLPTFVKIQQQQKLIASVSLSLNEIC